MSSGPGNIQTLILTHLPSTPILFNKLLWDMAHVQDRILHKPNYGFLPAGRINRSFEESFRRAVRGLHENGAISVTKRKFNDLQEAMDGLPFVTSCLELHHLRMNLKSEILAYITSGTPKEVDLDYEAYTVLNIKTNNPEVFSQLQQNWKEIQQFIISHIYDDSTYLDRWLNVLVRGRSLFTNRKLDFKKPLHVLYATLKERDASKSSADILLMIEYLLEQVRSYETWKVGAIKLDLYKVLKPKGTTDELKEYLFKKHRDDFVTLPKHKEPAKKGGFGSLSFNRKYDPILDKVVDRQLLKNHSYLSIPS